ncbi:MAG TPA: asparagine synthase-related protein [Candidatus Binataceae bacterium]|nr:asparagine synthase-related protein [Candidatus Binataceae bacterium]
MSGIAAIFNRDGRPADTAVLERMLAAAPYRGRDGFGRITAGPVALGHAMLHATPESLHETQPLADETAAIVLTLDGRVDNRAELIAALKAKGRPPRTDTDAELVLRAYQVWGEEFPRRIIGDFALVIWDGARRRLLCARDPVGVKTFYYYLGPRTFICASEPHQLFADPRVPREPNEGMIGEIAVQMPASREETLMRGVLRLPPCHALSVTSDKFRMWRYYEPDPSLEIRYRTDDEYAEHFRSVFSEAVRCRLRSHGRILADVSGGLDSSSIFCTAQSIVRRGEAVANLEPVSLIRHPDSDERDYIAAVERITGAPVTEVKPAVEDPATLEAQCRHYLDLPDYPNAAMADYDSLIEARPEFRVQLSGVGGDEWLSGSPYAYADLLRGLRIRAIVGRFACDLRQAREDPSIAPLRSFLISGLWPCVPRRVRLAARGVLRARAPHEHPLTREFALRIDLAARVRVEERAPRFPFLSQMDIYRTFTAGWLTHPIEMCERWDAWRGLDGRYPFMDRRVLEFALAIPEEQRMRDGVERIVVRNAMRDILPEEIRTRRVKATYASCYPETLKKAGGARVFNSMETVRRGWFDGPWLAGQYAAMLRLYAARDPRYMIHLRPLWMGFAIELWLKSVFSHPAAAATAPPPPGFAIA